MVHPEVFEYLLADLGSHNRNPVYVARSHLAVVGLVIFLRTTKSVYFLHMADLAIFLDVCQCVSSISYDKRDCLFLGLG